MNMKWSRLANGWVLRREGPCPNKVILRDGRNVIEMWIEEGVDPETGSH
jgi:hypothetical protein